MKQTGEILHIEDYIKQELMSPLQKFQKAPVGTIVFVWGTGFISNGIRIGQKLERISDIIKANGKGDLSLNVYMPTHVEQKVYEDHTVSAEMSGLKLMPFKRYFKKKDIMVALAYPQLKDRDDRVWARMAAEFQRTLADEGRRYDFGGLLSFIPRAFDWISRKLKLKKHHSELSYFCSEAVCKASKQYEGSVLCDTFKGLVCSQTSPEELWVRVCKDPHWETEIVFNSTARKEDLHPADPDPVGVGAR